MLDQQPVEGTWVGNGSVKAGVWWQQHTDGAVALVANCVYTKRWKGPVNKAFSKAPLRPKNTDSILIYIEMLTARISKENEAG